MREGYWGWYADSEGKNGTRWGWRDRLGRIMQGLLGHCQDFGIYPWSDEMLLGVEMKEQQHQIRILRSLVVWKKTRRWEDWTHGRRKRLLELLRQERMASWTMQKGEAWGKARPQPVPSMVGEWGHQQGTALDYCCGPNVCVLAKFICWSPNCQCIYIYSKYVKKVKLVIRVGISVLITRDTRGLARLSLHCVSAQ